jgi:fructokinase
MNAESFERRPATATGDAVRASVVALGEILWDLFPDGRRLGGAPLNFAAQLGRLGHPVSLISALGDDELGSEAAEVMAGLKLDYRYLQTSAGRATGTAGVELAPDGSPRFVIARPAAYDDLALTPQVLDELSRVAPEWLYFGTLFAASSVGKRSLDALCEALASAAKFYDVNLRPGGDSPELVGELLARADAVKLNEDELARVSEMTGLPGTVEDFCRSAIERFGWQAVAVSLGEQGCALIIENDYVEIPANTASIVDTVGAGDAFSAGFLHGLSLRWSAEQIGRFANALAGRTVGHRGGLPGL